MNDRPKRIISDQVFKTMEASGLFREGELISRVVIDLQAGHAPVIHVRRFGDERLLSVVETLDGIEIRDGGDS